MFESIQYVSTGFALAAFVVAAITTVIRHKLNERANLLTKLPEEDRAGALRDIFLFLRIDPRNLTKEQQYQLALAQIREQSQKYLITTVAVIIVAVVAAVISVTAIQSQRENKIIPSVTNVPGDELRKAETSLRPLYVRLLVDKSSHLSPSAKLQLTKIFSNSFIKLEIIDASKSYGQNEDGSVSTEKARNELYASNYLRSQQTNGKLTIYVTPKQLNSEQWSKLLMTTWTDVAIMSTLGVRDESPTLGINATKYIATTLILQVMASDSSLHGWQLLDERQADQYRGCLYDFYRDRATYILLTQQPTLCEFERSAIMKHYGTDTVSAIDDLLASIGKAASS